MQEKNSVELFKPKPYQTVGMRFAVFGKIPKSWLSLGKYGLGLSLMDDNGQEFMYTRADVLPDFLSRFRKRIKFYSDVDLSRYQIPKHPLGLIIEISGENNNFSFLPVIIKGSEENSKTDQEEMREKLSNTIKQLTKYKEDWINYRKDLAKIGESVFQDKEVLEGIFGILEKSEESFEPFSESDEDKERRELEEKYKEVIRWRGPLLGGIVGRMNGFDFRVYSNDHGKHFHVIHKGQGVDARFSFPQIELIDYKGRSGTIGSREKDGIRKFFNNSKNFQKLESWFQKRP